MKYSRILTEFFSQVWAILPEKYEVIRAFLLAKARGEDVPVIEIDAGPRRGVQMAGKVAVVPVFGTIAQRASSVEESSGAISTESLGATLDTLVADRQVRSIVLAFDSPGGSVAGVPELAKKIRDYRSEKKIVGLADSMSASAAYWLMSQASESYVTPSGQVGSIGVIAAHQDLSGKLESKGVKVTQITSSPFKGEMSPFAPLSAEAQAEIQSKVNHYHGMFVADIAKGRSVSEAKVNADFGQGRMLTAAQAKAAGMVDGVATLAQVLNRLGAESGRAAGAAAIARAAEAELGISG